MMYSQNFEVKCGEVAGKILKEAGKVAITFVASMLGQVAGNAIWDQICKQREKRKQEKKEEK